MLCEQLVDFLLIVKEQCNIVVEDFWDVFGVIYEVVVLCFINLVIVFFGIMMYFLCVYGDGGIGKVYENDGLLLLVDVMGLIEGEIVCCNWSVWQVFVCISCMIEFYQYIDMLQGIFFELIQIGLMVDDEFLIMIGVFFDDVKWF